MHHIQLDIYEFTINVGMCMYNRL